MQRILFICCISTLLISCKPESIAPVTTAIPKVARLKFTYQNFNNIDFHYDASGRVKSINAYYGHSPINVAVSDSIFHMYFTYSGSSQLPSSFHSRNYSPNTSETHFIKYDANNNPVQDSVFRDPALIFMANTNFQHHPNWVAYQTTTVGINGSITDTMFRVNSNFVEHYGEKFDFDSGTNPLNHLNLSPIFYVISEYYRPNWTFWSMWTLCNKNNYIRRKFEDYPGSSTFRDTSHLNFYYNSQGLPEKRYWIETISIFSDTVDVIEYIYQ